jgi:hypothetical protein
MPMYLGVNTGWRWVKPQSRKATFSALLGKAMEFERMVSWRKMLTTEEKREKLRQGELLSHMAEHRQDKFDGCAKGLVLYRKERIEE